MVHHFFQCQIFLLCQRLLFRALLAMPGAAMLAAVSACNASHYDSHLVTI